VALGASISCGVALIAIPPSGPAPITRLYQTRWRVKQSECAHKYLRHMVDLCWIITTHRNERIMAADTQVLLLVCLSARGGFAGIGGPSIKTSFDGIIDAGIKHDRVSVSPDVVAVCLVSFLGFAITARSFRFSPHTISSPGSSCTGNEAVRRAPYSREISRIRKGRSTARAMIAAMMLRIAARMNTAFQLLPVAS
jgi:hypothetical protein